MFTGNMVTEAIPARVYALYTIVNTKKEIKKNEVKDLMEPEKIYEGNSYFRSILQTAIELRLVDVEDNVVVPLVDKKKIRNIKDMRLFAISKLNSFEDEQFYRFTNVIVNMNEKILEYTSVTDQGLLSFLSDALGETIQPPMARGWRFWAQFLGFGHVNGMQYLPNAYVFTKDVLKLMELEKDKEYPIDDFMQKFEQYGRIITRNSKNDRNMNLALSSALRELHDNNEIELIYHSDAKSRWFLYPSNELFNEQVAAIRFKGLK